MTWEHFKKQYLEIKELGFALDLSRMNFADDFLAGIEPNMEKAFDAMEALEGGSIANPDEERMVGHYWLRNADLAPTAEIREDILVTEKHILDFSQKVHAGEISGEQGDFRNILVIGIGGSALGPQFVAQALGNAKIDKLQPFFFDNTDPDGMDRTLAALDGQLGKTLAIVISKSGGTAETRNGMLEAEHAWKEAGLNFARHAIAVTGDDSKLDAYATEHKWLDRFPMWDWVGGRTSELAAVGLLPAALQDIDIDSLLEGAREMDKVSRSRPMGTNPAALLAAMWYYATGGKGEKDMVILPYKDSLMLFSKYLQQLIMESLGKEYDLANKQVNQGIAVYGNKGSTDQHAYVQQLRDGVNNFFVTFIEVLQDREGDSIEVEPDMTSGDFLQAFYLGTREALYEKGRESITITVQKVSPFAVGALIGLYERAVGLYANLVNINAYHQPGVEAGKKAAAGTLDLRRQILAFLRAHEGTPYTVKVIAEELGLESHTEIIFKLLENISATPSKTIEKQFGNSLDEHRYTYIK